MTESLASKSPGTCLSPVNIRSVWLAISMLADRLEQAFHLGWCYESTHDITGGERCGAVPSLSSSSLTFLRLNVGFLRDSG